MEDINRNKPHTVFISYCWGLDNKRKLWVKALADRLVSQNCIDVKADFYDLKPGNDMYAYMEQMVNDPHVGHVLIICDSEYAQKANDHTGGVGTETQIISPEVYKNVKQEKFIPILAEMGETFSDNLPTYLKGRSAIDMSSDEVYEDGYEQLLRLISNQPEFPKPKLGGSIPNFESASAPFTTHVFIGQLKTAISNNNISRLKMVMDNFKSAFLEAFESMLFGEGELKRPYDEQIYQRICDMRPLRDDYVSFLNQLAIGNEMVSDISDYLFEIMEETWKYNDFMVSGRSYLSIQFDHFRFINYELFLYTILILIEKGLYNEAHFLLTTKFFINNRYGEGEHTFSFIYASVDSLDNDRKRRLGLSSYSMVAKEIMSRADIAGRNYVHELIDTELLIYYFSNLQDGIWFPRTYIYIEPGTRHIHKFLRKLKSKRFFNHAQMLFGVNNIDEMRKWISDVSAIGTSDGYSGSFSKVPGITCFIKPEEVGSYS